MRILRLVTTASLVTALTLSLAASVEARSGPAASGDATTKLGARDAKPPALPILQPARRPSGDDDVLAAGTGAVRDIAGRGGGLGYRVNVSVQSGVGAPRVDRVKFTPGGLAKKLVGSGFGTSGAVAEQTNAASFARRLPSRNGPAKPQTTIKIAPATAVSSGDVFTVVLPNGRRSNPMVLN